MLRYNVRTGVDKIKTKTAVVASAAVLVASGAGVAIVVPNISHADSVYTQASCNGQYHAAVADQLGNYGWLGPEGGTPGHHGGAVGQDPGATGYNNSQHVCQ